jgi:hypothetical protein
MRIMSLKTYRLILKHGCYNYKRIFVCICMYTCIHIIMHIYVYIYIYTCICIYIYIYIYIYVCIFRLILKHGRFNYVRMSQVVRYMFYKNILMSMAQFWFNFYNAWSGQKYYTEGAIQLFNLAYTALPIVLLGMFKCFF